MFEDIEKQERESGKMAPSFSDKAEAESASEVAAPSVLATFESRISVLREKGRKRGKRYSIVGLSAGILICAAVVAAGYFLWTEVFSISDSIDNTENMINVHSAEYGVTCSDECCLESLRRAKKNGYQKYDQADGCPDGYRQNTLKCPTSLIWCEPAEDASEGSEEAETVSPDAVADEGGAETDVSTGGENTIPDESGTETGEPKIDEDAIPSENGVPSPKGVGLDIDGDGLDEAAEAAYGTDPENPDTDGDGYSDGEEVKNGYNPNGEGML